MTRLEWFQSKIGHMLYRHAICSCEHCQSVAKLGIIVRDENHAQYLYEIEGTGYQGESKLRYFETMEEAKGQSGPS
jgi:hypothetical protein